MGTHTPGPWRASGEDRVVVETLLFCGEVSPAGGDYRGDIASIQSCNHIGPHGIGREEAAANARLIAAAPELLEALRKLSAKGKAFRNTVVETRGVIGMDEHDIAIAAADAAIAKATGAES